MGKLKQEDFLLGEGKFVSAYKLRKKHIKMIKETVKQQEEILKLKNVSQGTLEQRVNI